MKRCFLILAVIAILLLTWLPTGSMAAEADTLTATRLDWSSLTDNNTNTIGGTMAGNLPTVGNPRILVFYVTFQGGELNWSLTAQEARDFFFGTQGDSLRTYYERSSYGKVHIEGDLIEYTSQKQTWEYTDASQILDEILDVYRDTINWADYDSNGDGYVDGIYLVARTKHSWGGPNYVGNYFRELGQVSTTRMCFMDSQDLGTLCHETCHMFGPADMYSGVGVNPAGTKTDTIMEQNGPGGDLPGITKFVLGWMEDTLFLTGEGTITLELDSVSTHGNMLVIHPNGDPDNPNWMVVEFLTPEANNHYYGIRIWKTNMYLDENYNVSGIGELSHGLPSPYEYLEAMCPAGTTNYYFGPGESVTPYTSPATHYGISYQWVGSGKFMDEIGYSGISITVDAMTDTTATVTVTIDNTPEETPAVAEMVPGSQDPSFIDDSTRVLLSRISSPVPMELTGELFLTDPDTGRKTPVEAGTGPYGDSISLYITASDMARLDPEKAYALNLEENLHSYYGTPVVIPGFDGTVTPGRMPRPLDVKGPWANGNAVYNDMQEPQFFYEDENRVVFFSQENGKLWLRTVDVAGHKNTARELELGEGAQGLFLTSSIALGDSHYVTFFGEDTYSTCIFYAAVYDRQGNFVDDWVPENIYHHYTDDDSPFIMDGNNNFLRLVLRDGELAVEQLSVSRSGTYKMYALEDGYTAFAVQNIYQNYRWEIVVYDAQGNQMLHQIFSDDVQYDGLRVQMQDGILRTMAMGKDLTLYTYDENFQLIQTQVLLKDHGMPILDIERFGVDGGILWLELDAVPSTNTIYYSSTFLLVFDADDGALLRFYRHGNATFRYCGNVVYLGNGRFFFGNSTEYWMMSAWDTAVTVYGDANDDGSVNGKDLILLRQKLANWEVDLNMDNADCNGDGAVNGKDLILLRQKLANWDVTLGP